MISSEQIRAARALLRMEQKDLAAASGVSLPSIKRLETQPGPLAAQTRTIAAIEDALKDAGVIFVEENGEGPGVRLKKSKQPIYVDASQPAFTHHAGSQIGFLTLQEAVLAWRRLPKAQQATTWISVEGGRAYKETDIHRLHYGPKPSGSATDVVKMMDAAIQEHEAKPKLKDS